MLFRIIKQLKMVASFTLLITFLVVILQLINWVPSIIDKEGLRKYKTIERVKRELRITEIYMPVYLPESLNLKWPPIEIYAQKTPFIMIIMHFQHRDSKDIDLIIHQIDAKADYRPEPKIKFSRIKESPVFIKDREGLLTIGICEDNRPCNQVSWREGDFLLVVIGKASQRDLIRIASSMTPEF